MSHPDPETDRRTQILDAAAGLFARQGFHKTTTKQIAAEAGVAEGTIYNYFSSKEDLLLTLAARLAEFQAFTETAAEVPPADEEVFFQDLLEHRLRVVQEHGEVIRAILPQVLTDDELRRAFLTRIGGDIVPFFEDYVEHKVAQGRFRPVSPALVVRLVQSLSLGLLFLELAGDEVVVQHRDKLPAEIAELIRNGLRQ